jgi:hypothetical protein
MHLTDAHAGTVVCGTDAFVQLTQRERSAS